MIINRKAIMVEGDIYKTISLYKIFTLVKAFQDDAYNEKIRGVSDANYSISSSKHVSIHSLIIKSIFLIFASL